MGDELFTDGRLHDALDRQLERAEAVVDELPAETLSRAKATKKAMAQLAIEVPEINRKKASVEVSEGEPMTARLRLPFSGDAALFSLRPTEYSLEPPRAQVNASDAVLELSREFPVETSSDDVASWATRAADAVEQYLLWQAADIGIHRRALEARVATLVHDRRARLESVSEIQAALDDAGEI